MKESLFSGLQSFSTHREESDGRMMEEFQVMEQYLAGLLQEGMHQVHNRHDYILGRLDSLTGVLSQPLPRIDEEK